MNNPSRKRKAEQKVREGLESIMMDIDYEERKRKPKPPMVKGLRAEFLEKYRLEGYDKAKEAINSKFGGEVYDDKILEGWIKEDDEGNR